MKVLHLTTHLNSGGITTYILKLVKPLRELGIEISVASSGGTGSPLFQEAGAQTHKLDIRTKSELHPKLYLALPSLVRLIREKQIDLIHAHTRVTQVLAFWIQKIHKIPVVTTCHGFYQRRLGRRLNPAWGDCVIAISEGVEEHLLRDFHVPQSKARMIHNGVDIEALDKAYARHSPELAKVSYGFGPKDFVIGNVARLVADKGQEYLLRAVSELKQDLPSLRLLIVGDGRDRDHLARLAKKLKLENRVVFTGTVQDVTKPLAAMDLFVFPATWREGFGLSIIEAMACRKPIVATKIWNLSSLIQNGVTGILVEPKRIDILVSAISRLAKDPAWCQRLGLEGRKVVEQMFTIQRMAQEIAGVYKKISSSSPAQFPYQEREFRVDRT